MTLLCDMRAGKDTDWQYTFYQDGNYFSSYNANKRYLIQSLMTHRSGEYTCKGYNKNSQSYSKQSNKVSLTVSGKFIIIHPQSVVCDVGNL